QDVARLHQPVGARPHLAIVDDHVPSFVLPGRADVDAVHALRGDRLGVAVHAPLHGLGELLITHDRLAVLALGHAVQGGLVFADRQANSFLRVIPDRVAPVQPEGVLAFADLRDTHGQLPSFIATRSLPRWICSALREMSTTRQPSPSSSPLDTDRRIPLTRTSARYEPPWPHTEIRRKGGAVFTGSSMAATALRAAESSCGRPVAGPSSFLLSSAAWFSSSSRRI